jgi:hypothetical protein
MIDQLDLHCVKKSSHIPLIYLELFVTILYILVWYVILFYFEVSGFGDTTPIIREQTLKAVTALAPKLSSKIINNSLLRYLAKLQTDSEPGIRTNTTICLAKLSPYFDESVSVSSLIRGERQDIASSLFS